MTRKPRPRSLTAHVSHQTVMDLVREMGQISRQDLLEVLPMKSNTLDMLLAAAKSYGGIEEVEGILLWVGIGTVDQPEPQLPWVGFATSWETRSMFGHDMPVPWEKPFRCWAMDRQGAVVLLDKAARQQGYGLGGVHGITVDMEKVK